MTLKEYHPKVLKAWIKYVGENPDADLAPDNGMHWMLTTFPHDVEAAMPLYLAIGLSPTWQGGPTTRMFKENGVTVYVRLTPGGPQFGERITTEQQERIEKAARDNRA